MKNFFSQKLNVKKISDLIMENASTGYKRPIKNHLKNINFSHQRSLSFEEVSPFAKDINDIGVICQPNNTSLKRKMSGEIYPTLSRLLSESSNGHESNHDLPSTTTTTSSDTRLSSQVHSTPLASCSPTDSFNEVFSHNTDSGNRHTIPLLNGERILFQTTTPSVVYKDPFANPILGVFYVTNYRLYFTNRDMATPTIIQVPLGTINWIEKIGGKRSKGEYAYGIELYCKDLRKISFALELTAEYSRKEIYDFIFQHAFVKSSPNGQFFAYSYCPNNGSAKDGWELDNLKAEFKRQGIPNSKWAFTQLNSDYALCETYPSVLVVPANLSNDQIKSASAFRSKNRLPALSWRKSNGTCICRSSQPLVGIHGRARRSRADEDYISSIMKTNAQTHMIYIFDARPSVNANGNRMLGGGYELAEYYPNMHLMFLDIPNIHVMRESLRKIFELCFLDINNPNWLARLEETKWLEYIRIILEGSNKIVAAVDRKNVSVLVHCSDGWDRTAQLTSLSELQLDPYYRTIEGFEVLVQKEWLAFGHKFAERIGHGSRNHLDEQRSPVFVQFIDCVWQILMQFPYAFEFNEKFLLTILRHLYSNLYGTFLYNCERERTQSPVKLYTQSLWTHIHNHRDQYTNVLYYAQSTQRVLYPTASIRVLELWNNYYIQWNPKIKIREAEIERCRELEEIIRVLRKKCTQLEADLRQKQSDSFN